MRFIAILAVLTLAITSSPATAEEVAIEHQGTRLNANLAGTDSVVDEEQLILVVHGTRGHYGMGLIRHLQQGLAKRDLPSLAINLSLGVDDRHGFRQCSPGHDYTNAEALAEIRAWVRWLREKGVERITLLGHSRGGNQVARYATGDPGPSIQAAVLLAPATWNEKDAARHYRERFGTPLSEPLSRARQHVSSGKAEAWMEEVDFLYCEEARVQAATFLSYYGGDPALDTPSLLPEIELPVKLFVGTEDTHVPDLQRRTRNQASNAGLERTVVRGAGHFFKGDHTARIVDETADFVDHAAR